jgi:predicted alpha/beta-fold hydrolase
LAPLPSTPGPFVPLPWSRGGHRQTLLGFLARRSLAWNVPQEDLVVESEDNVKLLVRATFQEGARETSPALVLVHGLGGSDASSYLLATGLFAFALGYHVLRVNMRGAGDSLELCPRLYNAGLDSDLLAILERAAKETPRVFVAGFSLGANLTLLTLGRLAAKVPKALRAAGAVSPPLNLSACARALDCGVNRLYQAHFMRDLRRGYERRQKRLPGVYEAGREIGTRSVWEYDDRITAPYGGYDGAEDYYARSSAGPYLARIDRPALILAASDDPMIPIHSLFGYPLPASGIVNLEILGTGGHVGFVGRTQAPGRFWAAERLLGFFDGHSGAGAHLY